MNDTYEFLLLVSFNLVLFQTKLNSPFTDNLVAILSCPYWFRARHEYVPESSALRSITLRMELKFSGATVTWSLFVGLISRSSLNHSKVRPFKVPDPMEQVNVAFLPSE